jgi:hypothetical protein
MVRRARPAATWWAEMLVESSDEPNEAERVGAKLPRALLPPPSLSAPAASPPGV